MDSLIRSTFIDDIPIAARGSTGEDPDEALVTWAPSPSESEHLGTLDEPRDWFWQYWRDIEFDLARSLSETRIPSQPLRDKLVCLYFKHIHPLCPVFDEVEFFASYTFESNGMSFLKAISLLEFQAMMFAGSLHLNSHQIHDTQYQSTYQCHKSLFETAKTTYNACGDASPIVLTRAAILLTYWSPYRSELYTNIYWADQALMNARAAGLHEDQPQSTSLVSPGRRRLIWWCCLLRDRLLAFGLRRFQRLHQETPSRPLPTPHDFELKDAQAGPLDISCRLLYIENFIAQCELSQILTRILGFQEQRIHAAEVVKGGFNITDPEICEVTSLHLELDAWNHRYEKLLNQNCRKVSAAFSMPLQMTKIYYSSAIAALYLPYMSLTPRQSNSSIPAIALKEVKEAASQIAKSTEMLAYNVDSDNIPCAIGAWITLPIAVKMVFLRNSTDIEDPATELQEIGSLLNLLYLFKHRFSGGQFICNLLDTVISRMVVAGSKDNLLEICGLLQDAAGIIDTGLAHGIIPSAKL